MNKSATPAPPAASSPAITTEGEFSDEAVEAIARLILKLVAEEARPCESDC